MFVLSCSSMGLDDCNYMAQEDTAEKAVHNVLKHARQAHPDTLKKMSKIMSEQEIFDDMMSRVRQE